MCDETKSKNFFYDATRFRFSYQGECLQTAVMEDVLEHGVNSTAFRSLVTWLTNDLGVLLDLDEQV